MNYLEYYLNNCTEGPYFDYYEAILTECLSQDSRKMSHHNESIMLKKFRELLEPNGVDDFENLHFIILSFYLHHTGRVINELPEFLNFGYDARNFSLEVRSHMKRLGMAKNGAVAYQDRRNFAENFTFSHISTNIPSSESVDRIIQRVSTNEIELEDATLMEAVHLINISIENILKKRKTYASFDEAIFSNMITNQMVKDYRNYTHCFRHGADESLAEREQKKDELIFLKDYGITILKQLAKIKE